MCKGFMRFSRERVSEFEWLSNPTICYFFFRLLFKANYKDGRWQGVEVKRGQLLTGRKSLSEEFNLTERQVRTCLEKLTSTGYIDQQTTNKYTIITICNYDSWQSFEDVNDQQTTSKRPANDHNIINNEREEIKKDNVDSIPSTEQKKKKEKVKKEKDEKFEEVWLAYNKKGSKKDSLEQWQKLSDEEKERVLPHVRVYVSSRDRSFCKDFQRYLRDKIFYDVIVKGNDTIYDPDKFDKTNEYHPTTDGIFQYWNDERKCLMFNGYIDQLNDGYTDDTRPDGAKVAWSMYEWIWSSRTKQWIKQND